MTGNSDLFAKMLHWLSQPVHFFWICFLVLAVVYLTHLGMIPVHPTHDECRRALVPLEMCIRGDLITPTINGEIYLNKPPFYNWLVMGAYKCFGDYSPLAFRFPVILSLLLHGLIFFFISKKNTGTTVAALAALAFMTNGRTLIYDSLLGLLEHTMALMMMSAWLLLYYFAERKKYLLAFMVSYGFTAIAFLTKGLPAIAHLGIGLIVYFILTRQFRKLFHWTHFGGITLFIAICAAFYLPFLQSQEIPLTRAIEVLFSESAKRFEAQGWSHWLTVLIDFPLDVLRHFLPWTVFVLLFFQKDWWHKLKSNQFILYAFCLLVTNLPIYWLASIKQPHYLYFLIPLLYLIGVYSWEQASAHHPLRNGILWVLGTIMALAIPAAVFLPFSGWVDTIPGALWKSTLIAFGFALLLTCFIKMQPMRLFLFVGTLIWVRLAFNWFVIPQRVADQAFFYNRAKDIQQIAGEAPLHIMASYPAGYYDPITYPLTLLRREIIPVSTIPLPGAYLLMDDATKSRTDQTSLLSFPFVYMDKNERHDGNMHLIRME